MNHYNRWQQELAQHARARGLPYDAEAVIQSQEAATEEAEEALRAATDESKDREGEADEAKAEVQRLEAALDTTLGHLLAGNVADALNSLGKVSGWTAVEADALTALDIGARIVLTGNRPVIAFPTPELLDRWIRGGHAWPIRAATTAECALDDANRQALLEAKSTRRKK